MARDMAVTIDKSNARVQQMFRQIAPQYDRMNHVLSMNVDRYWRWRTVQLVRPKLQQPILDVCTGTGDLAFAFFKKTRGKSPIIGADFCREMLDIGERKKRRAGINEMVEFVEADAQQLPFEDDRFQVVTVAFGLRNIADTDRGLSEMVRVCQPGGRVGVLEFSIPQWQPMKAMYGFYFRRVLPRIGQRLAKNEQDAYNYLPQSVGEFDSGGKLVERMSKAGLSHVKIHSLTLGIATLYIGEK